jgi:hypothetical protein
VDNLALGEVGGRAGAGVVAITAGSGVVIASVVATAVPPNATTMNASAPAAATVTVTAVS